MSLNTGTQWIYVSAKDLIRNHLTMSLYNHAAIWKDNLEQRMVRSYFCNGYLMLNNAKMSKSTGNFMTLRECIDAYGVEASRIAMADAGDSLDDANFDGQVANAAILKLFTLEEWIKVLSKRCSLSTNKFGCTFLGQHNDK